MHAADDIRFMFESRPCILYASTHDPEEKIARDIHLDLQKDFPELLTVIVPRHPNRGEDIAAMLNEDGLSVARRSLKMSPRKGTDIYVADTLGELGLFYHLSNIVFVGNSMGTKPGGGHNLMEPAWHGCAIVSGDDLHNFSVQADEMPNAKACLIVHNRDELLKTLEKLLVEEDTCRTLSENALAYVNVKQKAGMDKIIAAIQPACQKAGLV
jgi:3-deoxy-D-manno-octulosonic-acid transferase